jgi:uncharacterized protein YbjT (DUF2867 family)
MTERIATVFGGTGFLGRRVVRRLHGRGFSVRIASRGEAKARELFGTDDPRLQPIEADVHDERSVTRAVAGADAVVNAVSLYVERGDETFTSVHVRAAERVADQARRAGVRVLAHISGIGTDAASPSPYVSSRGEGEAIVRAAFAGAIIIRPAVMFGPDDAFLTTIVGLLRSLPVYPMFGSGQTRLQPAYVEDVAEAVARVLQSSAADAIGYELGGPVVYSYEALLKSVADAARIKPVLFPMPFAAWHVLARLGELLPHPPITRNQVELMQLDNVAAGDRPGFNDLGIVPRPIDDVLPSILQRT